MGMATSSADISDFVIAAGAIRLQDARESIQKHFGIVPGTSGLIRL
ncbi:hypothetical protein ABB02_01983 [Clostridiaceae bacterium JG1575]|nr:hypothetical protein ABB02_01983 [Clostridiaceae bacterium JG1575]